MSEYIVRPGETIGDVILNQTGAISNWDALLQGNPLIHEWVPILNTGDVITVPDTISRNLNNVRQFALYPLNNASVPGVYDNIQALFNLMVFVTTTAASVITGTTATSGGVVSVGGGATITARGVCWSTSHNPIISGSHTTNGSGTGAFTSSITGLTGGTTYYVRAYAQTATGVTYGSEVSFETAAIPVYNLSTVSGSNYTANKSTTGNILYVLKIDNLDSTGRSITIIAGRLLGVNIGGDIASSGFKIYRNTTPDLSGSPALAVSASMGGTTAFSFSYSSLSIFIPSGSTRYLIFAVDIASGATTGNTLYMHGAEFPVELTFDSPAPVNNTQSDISPVITIGT